MKKRLLLLVVLLGFLSSGFSQTVSIINKKFVLNSNASCPIYFNGANTPWNNWNDFGGNYNATFWSTHFATLKANGINASRVWISCNGDVQPNINTDGTVTGVSTQFWANLDNFFQSAQANGIYIMATMMSFDHTKNTYTKYQSWRNMLNDQTKVQTYCDNYLVPFVNRYKSNPYLMSIDISNEIEWVAEDASNMKCSYAVLQRFVAMCASAIHNNPRTDGTTVLVTLGSAATKWNATKMRNGSNGTGWQNNSDGNKWSDAALKAQYNQANAILDYYSPHYYSWIDEYYSNPYVKTPTDFGIDEKPVVIGETPAGNPGTPNLAVLASYNALKNNGYQGHFPWTSNGVDALGDIAKFGTDAKTFATNNNALVYPACTATCTTAAPTVTTPVVYCRNGSSTPLTATGTALKWYADNTTTTALTGAPTPSTSIAGTINYFVSQTLNGCEGPRALIAVTVNTLPTATITTTTSTTFCQGGSVTLTSSTGTSYQWNNAAGPISSATNATYAATTAGSYTVKVTNANNCSANSTSTAVIVNALPTATVTTGGATTFCQGGSVTLTSSAGTSYQWNNAAGPISSATNATYAATTAGSYTVKVTNANNCSATSTSTAVTVNALPTATISTTTSTTFCQGGSVTLTSSAGASYQWNNAVGSIPGATNATYAATTAGSYTVKVTNANNCSANSTSTAVIVNALPTATVTTGGATTFCQGGSVTLTSSAGTSYQWNNAAGPISSATNATYAATTAGSYTVKVTNANNCSATSTSTAVTVNALPTATISTTTSTTFCQGGSVTLTSSTGTSYQWHNAVGLIANATNATYVATATGSYTVKVTNANNCSATSAATAVTVNALPTGTVTAGGATTFCQGGSVTLTSSAGTSYQWNNAAGPIANATNATYDATTAGSYTVKVTNANNCSATSAATAVTVNALPTATISTTTSTTFCQGGSVTLTSSTGTSYQWNNAAGPISSATNATYAATVSGSYTVKVTNANTCSATSTATAVTVSSALNWYQDLDGDGKGDAAVTQTACTQPTGYVSVSGDACPADANKLSPGACGCGIAETNSDTDQTPDCIDTDDDNDGVLDASDCSPLNATIGAATVWYQDLDGDGTGNTAVTQTTCTQPTDYVSVSGDACPTDANKIAAGNCGCGIAEGTCQTTGVVDLKSTESIKIMPNPSSDQFNLILVQSAVVHIYSIEGKLIEIFPDVTDVKFGSEYAKGLYMIQIMNGSTTQVVRIIKQ